LDYRTIEVGDAAAALAVLSQPQKSQTDMLLFTDMVMPGINCRELAGRARVIQRKPLLSRDKVAAVLETHLYNSVRKFSQSVSA
jgi:CheY-like chemotaxis protein